VREGMVMFIACRSQWPWINGTLSGISNEQRDFVLGFIMLLNFLHSLRWSCCEAGQV
jgi:hypothetical protein